MLPRYFSMVVRYPLRVLFVLLLITLGLASQLSDFRLDASSDSLVIEGDADLEYAREVGKRYGSQDFVFIMVTPQGDLFTPEVLDRLRTLQDELIAMERVDSIESIFTVPLFRVADVSLSEIDAESLLTLEDQGVDLQAAREDLTSSQAYTDALISEDGRSTTLAVYFRNNENLANLLDRRTELREASRAGTIEAREREELRQVEQSYDAAKQVADRNRHEDIATIRSIIDEYRDSADIVMGGVPMIADDLVTFVKRDLVNFGSAILVFIIAALYFLFRKVRYVVVPIATATLVTVCVTGMLGLVNWPVTVISSNFISLLLIITISLNVHLIVRYRELAAEAPETDHRDRLVDSATSMFQPCLYTALTTIVAFGSLVISNIPPIVDFGWMMAIGVVFAFAISFSFFPACMSLFPALPPEPPPKAKSTLFNFTNLLAQFTLDRRSVIVGVSVVLAVAVAVGVSRLKVENSFINYFDQDTEIYQGMVSIDERMGGTTPLDVIVKLRDPDYAGAQSAEADATTGDDDFWNDEAPAAAEDDFWNDENPVTDAGDDFWNEEEGGDDFDDFDAPATASAGNDEAYWFTSDKMAEIVAMHDYLDAIPETGKVLSLATLLKIAYGLNDDQPLNSIELAVLYNRIPDEYKDSLLRPYVSVPNDEVRFSIRVRESDPDLVRGELMTRMREGLQQEFGLSASQVQLSGMLVLYNNMLQSLFESQILTLGVVLAVILVMFVVLFRSLKLALLGIVPNILAAGLVLGIMGWLGIPLDMMTITIAAISVGIGVDNTIHYVHRFQKGFAKEKGDYEATVRYSHGTIGKAIYYTGFTIVVGFSILVLSNFIPTIYFGLLSSTAMIAALLGSLSLLPSLILIFRPLGNKKAG